MNQTPYLSLVIPCYNEQENVPTLLERVEASLKQIGRPFEVLIIDDGSTDRTPELLHEAMRRLPWLRVIRMGRNGGQSAAFEAGFEAAHGEIIATIDADLQNDPEEIPRLLPLLENGDDGQWQQLVEEATAERIRLEGELHTELEDGRTFTLRPGMSYQVADGAEPHRSSTAVGAKLFVLD